jgi:hypothetical protein
MMEQFRNIPFPSLAVAERQGYGVVERDAVVRPSGGLLGEGLPSVSARS